jgi:tripartite-type tricarboxylate transporter receptor subunit TctC
MTDVIAGQLSYTFGSHLAVDGNVKAGRLRPLAVTSRKRSAVTPDLPTVAEAGYPDYDATAWWGIVVPGATPRAVVERLHADVVRVLETADVRDRLLGQAVEVAASTPAAFRRFIGEEVERWARVVRQSGAKPE